MIFRTILLVMIPFSIWAQEGPVESEKKTNVEASSPSVPEQKPVSEEKTLKYPRLGWDYTAQLNYSYIDLLIPSKIGATVGLFRPADDKFYEVEYLRASLSIPMWIADIGKMTEQRVSFISRHFGDRKNFNWYWGLSYNDFVATIGDDLLSSVNRSVPNYDVIDVKSLGVSFGVGHRWYFKDRYYINVDWFGWSQPIYTIKKEAPFGTAFASSDDKDKVDKVLNAVLYFPRISALKFGFGFSF